MTSPATPPTRVSARALAGRVIATLVAGLAMGAVATQAPFVDLGAAQPLRGAADPPPAGLRRLVSSGEIRADGWLSVVERSATTDCEKALRDLLPKGGDAGPLVFMDGITPQGGSVIWLTGMDSLPPDGRLPEGATLHVATASGCGGSCPGSLVHQAFSREGSAPPPSSLLGGEPIPPLSCGERIARFESGTGVSVAIDKTPDLELALELMSGQLRLAGWREVPPAAGGTWTGDVAGTWARAGAVIMLAPQDDAEGPFLVTLLHRSGSR